MREKREHAAMAESELGFVPSMGLREGIGAQLEWLRSIAVGPVG